jgi:LPS-assembly protein
MLFKVYDVPVLWFPFYTMPDPGVKHKTGLLMPSFNSTNKMGLQINLPVHISFSNTHDATVTLSYLTRENPLFQLEHRLNLAHSEYRTRGSFTHNRVGENRWHIFNNDRIDLGEHARASVYVARTSDKTYLQKYGFYENQPYLDSGVKLETFTQTGYVIADTHTFQELRIENWGGTVPSGNILPNIRGVFQTEPLFKETYATFGADVLGIDGDGTSSQRFVGNARIVSPWTLWGGNRITFSGDARYDVYNFNKTLMADGADFSGVKNRFLPSGYVEWGLPLVRPAQSWSQTIEPRARLTMRRRVDEEQFAKNNDSAGAFLSDTVLFSNNRFAGYDLWENGTFADYGVRWATFNSDGRQIETFVGQSYDFDKRADTDLNSGFHNGGSDYVGRIGFSNSRWLDLSSRVRVNRNNFDLRHVESSAQFGKSDTYFSLGHIWARQLTNIGSTESITNEATIGAGLKITNRWSVRANAIYNWTENKFFRHGGTLFYNHPCYYLSLGYQRDNSVYEDYSGNTTIQLKFGISIDGQHY